MSGKIEYSLGLATAGFLGPLGGVVSKLSGFMGATATLGGAAAAVFSQISKGGALVDLSNRTGEAIKDLFQLQFAFEQSGVAAASLPTILQKYRAALSGVGEMGESTSEAFSLIGTSIEDLRKVDAPEAFEKIFGGLNKLDRNTATGVAQKIFGRGASGDILQLARNANGFAEALQRAAPHAELMARNAESFDRFGDVLGDLKLEFDGIAASVAEKVTPALNLLTTQLRDKDFAGIGEVFELSMKAGIQEVTFFMSDAAKNWGDIVRKELGNAADVSTSAGFWEKVGKGTLGSVAGLAGLWGQVGGAIGIPGAQAQGDLRMLQAEQLFQAAGLGGGVLAAVAEQMSKDPGSRVNVFREQLRKKLEADAAMNGGKPKDLDAEADNIIKALTSGSRIRYAPKESESVNALRRIGFGSGGQSDGLQVQRKQLNVLETLSNKTTKLIEVCGMDKPLRVLND